jgi:hypothetical protein
MAYSAVEAHVDDTAETYASRIANAGAAPQRQEAIVVRLQNTGMAWLRHRRRMDLSIRFGRSEPRRRRTSVVEHRRRACSTVLDFYGIVAAFDCLVNA